MAITDNTFTKEELIAAAKANPALIPEIKTALTSEFKMIMHEPNEHEEFKKNFEAEVARNKTREFATNLEKDVEEATGIKKAHPDEKYYDYFKRAMKEATAKLGTLETELTELRGKANLSDIEKARMKTLEASIAEKEEAMKKLREEKDSEINTLKIGLAIDTHLAGLRSTYKKDLDPTIIQVMEEKAKTELLKKAKLQPDGAVTFLNDKGEVDIDTKTYKPKAADVYLKDILKPLVDEGRKAAGGGTGNGTQGNGSNGNNGAFSWAGVPEGVKSRSALGDHLKKNGILDGTKEWDEVFAKEEVSKLPLR